MRSIDLTNLGQLKHADAFYTLDLLANTVDRDRWCLVGGLMVMLNVIEAGCTDKFRAQQTKDADIVVELAATGQLQAVAHTLQTLGLSPAPAFPGQDHARCTFISTNHTTIDVLAPDTANDEDLDLGDGLRTLAIPGGRHALLSATVTEIIYVSLDGEERDADHLTAGNAS